MTHLERIFSALYVSEGWYVWWELRDTLKKGFRPLYYKTRAIVIYDRVLNNREEPAIPPK